MPSFGQVPRLDRIGPSPELWLGASSDGTKAGFGRGRNLGLGLAGALVGGLLFRLLGLFPELDRYAVSMPMSSPPSSERCSFSPPSGFGSTSMLDRRNAIVCVGRPRRLQASIVDPNGNRTLPEVGACRGHRLCETHLHTCVCGRIGVRGSSTAREPLPCKPSFLAEKIATRLKQRGETVAVSESSTGGLISAALLAVPGASAYSPGRRRRLYAPRRAAACSASADRDMAGIRSASEPYAALAARTVRERHGATWGWRGNGRHRPHRQPLRRSRRPLLHRHRRPGAERTLTLRTGSADRQANMRAFAAKALRDLPGGAHVKTVGHGYTWNDLEVGLEFRTLNRTITESDLVGFINATGMLEMIFIDQTFEHEGGIKGGRVVPAALPYCLMEGLLCQTVQQMTGLALLEIEKKVLKPTLVGDTIHSEVEVVAIKPTSKATAPWSPRSTTSSIRRANGSSPTRPCA